MQTRRATLSVKARSELSRLLASRDRKAGGSLFYINKSPLDGYQAYVEKMMPKWFKDARDYSGEFVKGSVKWGKPENEGYMLATSHPFTFEQTVDGAVSEESGKITARNDGNSFYIAVLLRN